MPRAPHSKITVHHTSQFMLSPSPVQPRWHCASHGSFASCPAHPFENGLVVKGSDCDSLLMSSAPTTKVSCRSLIQGSARIETVLRCCSKIAEAEAAVSVLLCARCGYLGYRRLAATTVLLCATKGIAKACCRLNTSLITTPTCTSCQTQNRQPVHRTAP